MLEFQGETGLNEANSPDLPGTWFDVLWKTLGTESVKLQKIDVNLPPGTKKYLPLLYGTISPKSLEITVFS